MEWKWKFAAAGTLALSLLATAPQGADPVKARVGDLVNAIASRHGVSADQVLGALKARGRRVELGRALTQGIAVELLSDLGVRMTASNASREMTEEDLARLRSAIALTRVSPAQDAAASQGDEGRGREPGEVVNRGQPRPGQARTNSNADANAFETLREDPRD